MRSYRFPTDTTIFGPAQIEARIDQDPIISAQISLWNQSGSSRRPRQPDRRPGRRLAALPPAGVPPVHVAAFPEFQKIVVASPTTDRLGRLAGRGPDAAAGRAGRGAGPGSQPDAGAVARAVRRPRVRPPRPGRPRRRRPTRGLPTDVAGLVEYANTHFEAAQAALRAGDFATYGTEMDKVEDALAALGGLTGAPARSRDRGAGRRAPELGAARWRGARLRLRWGATISGAVVVTLVRPLTWASACWRSSRAAGSLLAAWPILVLPTPTGLQNALGDPISSLVFGAPSATLLALIVGGLVAGARRVRRRPAARGVGGAAR